jgi:hypothetical protein
MDLLLLYAYLWHSVAFWRPPHRLGAVKIAARSCGNPNFAPQYAVDRLDAATPVLYGPATFEFGERSVRNILIVPVAPEAGRP